MKLVIIDGQSGRMGALLAERIKAAKLPCEVLAIGTNAIATAAMMKAGADQGATGENAVIHNAGRADLILGPIGVILANGILGEVSPAMAAAVSGSEAVKVLIPSSTCGVHVAGTEDCRLDEYLRRAVEIALRELEK